MTVSLISFHGLKTIGKSIFFSFNGIKRGDDVWGMIEMNTILDPKTIIFDIKFFISRIFKIEFIGFSKFKITPSREITAAFADPEFKLLYSANRCNLKRRKKNGGNSEPFKCCFCFPWTSR